MAGVEGERGRPRPFVASLDPRVGPGELWAITGVTALALALRLPWFGQSLFGDELFLWAIVDDRSLGQVLEVVHDTEKTPLLGFLLAWLPAKLGDSTSLVRVASLVAGVATVPLLFVLGRRTVGISAGLVAAAWFALSPFEIFYGTEARSYAIVTAFVLTSTLALLAALDGGRRWWWWALYVLSAAAAVHTHYIAALTLVPQALWTLWTHRESFRVQALAHGLVVVAFLPWLPSFIVQARHSADEARRIEELAPLTISNAADFAGKPLVAHPFVSVSDIPGRIALLVLALALVIGIVYAARARPPRGRCIGLLTTLALVPLAALIVYSARPETSFLLPRNVACAVPYALLVFGWLLTSPPGTLGWLLPATALAMVAIGAVQMLNPDRQRPDARDAAEFIERRIPPRAPVVDVPGPHAIRTYLDPSRPVFTLDQFGETGWARAAAEGLPVVITFPDAGRLSSQLRPPARYAREFRRAAYHRSKGTPIGVGAVEFVPR